MVTTHFQSIKQTTNKQYFVFTHIKPKYLQLIALQISKETLFEAGKSIVLKIMI